MRAQPARLVFIDETSVKTNMTPLRGRSLRGQRLAADAPFGKWHTQTFIAGLRCHELVAPWVIKGAINGAAFDVYVETQLAPTLSPGDIVILDNLNVHKSPRAAQALKQRGAWFLFLPKYSPDALAARNRVVMGGGGVRISRSVGKGGSKIWVSRHGKADCERS